VRSRTDGLRERRHCRNWRVKFDAPEPQHKPPRSKIMSLGAILLIIVILMLVGVLPTWPHARSWGYGPSGLAGVVVLVVVVMLVMGRL
jgi:hypothetical protein